MSVEITVHQFLGRLLDGSGTFGVDHALQLFQRLGGIDDLEPLRLGGGLSQSQAW